jgi:hypothetical protein
MNWLERLLRFSRPAPVWQVASTTGGQALDETPLPAQIESEHERHTLAMHVRAGEDRLERLRARVRLVAGSATGDGRVE